MEAKKTLLTYTGLKKLEDELENLKVVKRKEVAGKIKEAREPVSYTHLGRKRNRSFNREEDH